jgi:hypothetical protein
MQKGSRQCAVNGCRMQATGYLLHIRHRNMKRFYGSPGCQMHLEEAIMIELSRRLHIEDWLLFAARGYTPDRAQYMPMGPPVGSKA